MTIKEQIDALDWECEMYRRISELYYKYLSEKCTQEQLTWLEKQVKKIRKEIP